MSNIKTFTNKDDTQPINNADFKDKVRYIGQYESVMIGEIVADKPCTLIILSAYQFSEYISGNYLHQHIHRITKYKNIDNWEIINTPKEMEYQKVRAVPIGSNQQPHSYALSDAVYSSRLMGKAMDIEKVRELSSRVCTEMLKDYVKQEPQIVIPYYMLLFAKEIPNIIQLSDNTRTFATGNFKNNQHKNEYSPFDIAYKINLYGNLVSSSK